MDVTCVIPAFETPELLGPCIASVVAQRGVALEIIVTDDSRSDAAREVTRRHPAARYVPGPRTGNPVDNWNHGLALAGGGLCVVVHHDEVLLDPTYLARAVWVLSGSNAPAAVGRVRVTGVDRPSRHALAVRLARAIGQPAWLLWAINWIGPTAAFVFRRGPTFDPRLVQLVDVEFYWRVIGRRRPAILEGVCVGSLGHHGAQITARIDSVAEARRDFMRLAGLSSKR